MKKISLLLLTLVVGKFSFGKAVSEQTALTTGYNYLLTKGVQVKLTDMSTAYAATSVVNGGNVTDFYVFNTGEGFVIVSGDDVVTPVLGYSTEGAFRATDIPGSVADWLNNYKKQIDYAIGHGQAATLATAAEWSSLGKEASARSAARTTSTLVAPMVMTKWDQAGYYNKLCPFDVSADTNALTGCVATAMAQVMRFWHWPDVGVSTHSYSSSYGSLSANFAGTTYAWDSMPTVLYKPNMFVATAMSHAGISVNMSYGVSASGAFVTQSESPVRYCAEYALKTFFKYKSTLKGYSRSSYDDSDWLHMITFEMDNHRPVLHTGSGSAGGHCFVIDGYTGGGSQLHVNWGWGGFYNGYYVFTNLAPNTSETFNDDQTIIVGITPDNDPKVLSVNETAVANDVVYPNPVKEALNVKLADATSKITVNDIQGRILKTVTPGAPETTISVSDLTPGMYFVTINSATGTTTKKIVKE